MRGSDLSLDRPCVGLVLEPNAATRAAITQALEDMGVRAAIANDVPSCATLVDRARNASSNALNQPNLEDRVALIVVSLHEAVEASPALLDVVEDRVFTPPILVTVNAEVENAAGRLLGRSIWGVLAKPMSTAEATVVLTDAIQEGQRRLADRALVTDYHRRESQLNQAEREVLAAVAEGKLNKQIAREMGVSVRTVEQRRRRVFTTMNVASAAPLAERVATVKTLERLHAPRHKPARPVIMPIGVSQASQMV